MDESEAAWSVARGAVTATVGRAQQEIGAGLRKVERAAGRTRDEGSRVGRLVLEGKIVEAWNEVRGDGAGAAPAETNTRDRENPK